MHDLVSKPRAGALRLGCLLLTSLAAGCSDPGNTTPAAFDVARYDLKGEFDWARSRLTATVGITLALKDGAGGPIVLDSAVEAVEAVRVAGGGALAYAVDPALGKLTIDLPSGAEGLAAATALSIEIDYVAAAGTSLHAVPTRKGDPLPGRALYTEAEPLGAAQWMPCFNDPSDRAVFSVDLRLDNGERMIANGDLVEDRADGASSHRVRYETGYPLPTYLMAFAVGDFEVERATHGALPLSIWHRRGVTGDYQRALDELGREIDHFERLLVPYPFEKYALVLLPEFPGGMENAGITFQGEISSTQFSLSSDLLLAGHELAHQWFGDLVTVATWDDVWIKEGMATLLQAEGARVYTDESGLGTLDGDSLLPQADEAIRDPALAPDDKYTSGPYDRAAWLLTQIRSLAGEEAFWAALRGVLDEHRFGDVGTKEFLDAFAPALGPDGVARARRAVDARALPRLALVPTPSGGAVVTLSDPDGALLAPLDLTWVAEDGATRTVTLAPGAPVEVAAQTPGELLILDPSDRHPGWGAFLVEDLDVETFNGNVAPFLLPASAPQRARFLDAGGAHQREALEHGRPRLEPEEVAAFVTALDSAPARALALSQVCALAGTEVDPARQDRWQEALGPLLLAPPATYGLNEATGFEACSALVGATDLFAAAWSALQGEVPSEDVSEARLSYLADFTLPAGLDLATWGHVATAGGSVRARRIAVQHLRASVKQLDPAELPAYRSFFVKMLGETEVAAVLRSDLQGIRATKAASAAENAAGLTALVGVLHAVVTEPVHGDAVCAAYALTGGEEAAWTAFAAAVADAPLSGTVRAIVENPTGCN